MTEHNKPLLPYTPILGINPSLIPISNSEIGTFKECKRKWYQSYYLGLGPREHKATGALAMGTRIHKCLEEMYKNGRHPAEVHKELIALDMAELESNGVDTTDLMKDADLGRIMMEGYVEWVEETGADADIEVTDSEKKLSMILFDGKVEVRGKLDLRIRRINDGARQFLDFKTLAQYDTYLKTAHMAEQLKLYLVLEHVNREHDRVDGATYRLIKKVKRSPKAKPPFYMDVEIRHNKKTLESYWSALHGVVRSMLDLREQLDAGADPNQVAYPTPSNDCSWKCPFYTACPMFDDGSAVADYIEDNFEQYDPYARYEEEEE